MLDEGAPLPALPDLRHPGRRLPERRGRGATSQCWHLGLISTDDYQAAAAVHAVSGESEPRGRDLCGGELRGLFEPAPAPPGPPPTSTTPLLRADAAFLALAYGCGLRRAEVLALDLNAGPLKVRRGKGRKLAEALLRPRPAHAFRRR